jgi:hypothetical protein
VNQLMNAAPEEIYGARAMLWYGLARDFLLFHESKGQLSKLYAAMKAGQPPAVDDAEFKAFAGRIRQGDPI